MEHPLVSDAPRVQGTLCKMVTQNKDAIVIAIDAPQLVQESLDLHLANPPGMYHLGQALLSALMLQALPDMQDQASIDLQWKVSGAFGSLFAECKTLGGVRGTLFNPSPEVDSLKVSLGKGLFQVRRVSKNISTGITESCGDVVLDVLHYLEKSEQRSTSLGVWIDIAVSKEPRKGSPFIVQHARGFLVDVLPHKTENQMHAALYQWHQHIQSLGPISSWELGAEPHLKMLGFLSGEVRPHVTTQYPVFLHCTCTQDRAEKALAISEANFTNQEELAPKSVRCEYCGKEYLF